MITSPLEKKKGYETVGNVQTINALNREKEVDMIFLLFSVSIFYLAEHDKAIKPVGSGALFLTNLP